MLTYFDRLTQDILAGADGEPARRKAAQSELEQLTAQGWNLLAPVMAIWADERAQIQDFIEYLEGKGWHLRNAIQRIWDGDRHLPSLSAGLSPAESMAIQRILDLTA